MGQWLTSCWLFNYIWIDMQPIGPCLCGNICKGIFLSWLPWKLVVCHETLSRINKVQEDCFDYINIYTNSCTEHFSFFQPVRSYGMEEHPRFSSMGIKYQENSQIYPRKQYNCYQNMWESMNKKNMKCENLRETRGRNISILFFC